MAVTKSIDLSYGSAPTIKCNVAVTAAIGSDNKVTFTVNWTLADLGSNSAGDYYYNRGVILKYCTGQYSSSSGSYVYNSVLSKELIKGSTSSTARVKWDETTGSFSVTLTECTRATNAVIKFVLSDNPTYTNDTVKASSSQAVVFDIVGLNVTAGTGISAVSKSPNQTYHIAGDSITVNATVASGGTGYTNKFGKWTSNNTAYVPNSTSQKYAFKASDAEDITLTASATQTPWSANLYFHPNGGTATADCPLLTSGDFAGFSSTQQKPTYAWTDNNVANVTSLFTRTGYHIADNETAWILDSVDSGKYLTQANTDFSKIITSNGQNIKAYANWTLNTYTIRYNPNGASQESYTSSHTYGIAQNLSANTFAREGYEFVGWATSPNNAASYVDQESVLNLTTTNNAEVS